MLEQQWFVCSVNLISFIKRILFCFFFFSPAGPAVAGDCGVSEDATGEEEHRAEAFVPHGVAL